MPWHTLSQPSSTLVISLIWIWSNLNCNLVIILMTLDMRTTLKVLPILLDISVKPVQTGRYKIYDMIYNLLKLVLLLPMAMASVERVTDDFSEN